MASNCNHEKTKPGPEERAAKKHKHPIRRHKRRRKDVTMTQEATADDPSSDDSEPSPTTEERKKTLLRLVATVGKLETLDQVAAASHYMTSMGCTKKDLVKFECFNIHVTKVGVSKVWPEIIMYRSTGQISTYFLDGQNLRGSRGRTADLTALDELEVCVVGWVRLASEGRLSHLEQRLGFEVGEEVFDSHAARFRAFLRARKSSKGFASWNYDEMKRLRYEIYRVVEHNRPLADEQMVPSANRSNGITQEEAGPYSAPSSSFIRQSDSPSPSSNTSDNPENSENMSKSIDSEQLQDLYEELEQSVSAKRRAFAEAQANADGARAAHETAADWNSILNLLQRVVVDARQNNEEWTVDSARALAQSFSAIGAMASESVEDGLVAPLAAQDEAEKDLEIAERELAAFSRRL
ncbi:hypothetical protein BKA61DRAFT_591446 [Leptodontidium sp. MPI-SDFR-AT-0119]|nr:hypothetical protein BKA61DRAFT_591446 [Leptodontidium sp. MPI-SDFR-AT-0119]